MKKKQDTNKRSNYRSEITDRKKKNPLLYFGSVVVLVIIAVTFIGAPALGQFVSLGASTIFDWLVSSIFKPLKS